MFNNFVLTNLEEHPTFEQLHSDEKIHKFFGEDASFSSLALSDNVSSINKLTLLYSILAARLDESNPEKFGSLTQDLYQAIEKD